MLSTLIYCIESIKYALSFFLNDLNDCIFCVMCPNVLLGIRIPEVYEPKGIPQRESKSMRRRRIFSLPDCGQCSGGSAWLAHGNRFPGH